MDHLALALNHYFGWKSFKFGQRKVIDSILSGRDSLAVLPTGGGKSLCYQLPALIREGLVVVISPLVSLMEDQLIQLHKRGIKAISMHSSLDKDRQIEAVNSLKDPKLRLLYLAPERLKIKSTRLFLSQKSLAGEIVAIAIDEAHCISAWGHDFRPDYRRLGELRFLCPGVPIVALSATAEPKVRADMIRLLDLRNPFVQVCSAQRKNLYYSMRRRSLDPLSELLEALHSSRGASLIYARTRRSVESWSEALQNNGFSAVPYHAGLMPRLRQEALAYFLEEEKPVLVATVAFGMGVDRPDVGLVVHLDLPSAPEAYLQQAGRAGRDGLPANCMIWFSPGDRSRLSWAMKTSASDQQSASTQLLAEKRFDLAQDKLRRMEAIAEGSMCFEQALLLSVGEIVEPCGHCDRCQTPIVKKDWSDNALTLLVELKDKKGMDLRTLVKKLSLKTGMNRSPWSWLVRRMVQEELIGEINDGSQMVFLRESGRRFISEPWPLNYSV